MLLVDLVHGCEFKYQRGRERVAKRGGGRMGVGRWRVGKGEGIVLSPC